MRRCRFWIDEQCSSDQSHCRIVVTELLFRNTEHMQSVKMIVVLLENLPVSLLRLGQKPAPMAVQSVSERTGGIVSPLGSRSRALSNRTIRSHRWEFLDAR